MLYYETKHPERNEYISNEFFQNFNFPLHIHNHLELAYLIDGEMEVHIDDNVFNLTKGDICLIKPMESHSYTTNSRSKCQIVVISTDYADKFIQEYKNYTALNPVIKGEFNSKIMALLHEKGSNYYLMKSLINYIIYMYIASTSFIKKNMKIYSFIKNVIEYIDNNYDKEPSLEILSKELGYTPTYLSALINSTFNKTFINMINEKRVAKAVHLLCNSNLNITEIADSCGYNTLRSFNRNFLSLMGLSPTDFRNKAQENQ